MDGADIVTALRAVLPEDCLLTREEERRPYECDGLTAFRRLPQLVALPRTDEQVRQVLITCNRLGVPLVARGSGTGLSGGATPHEQGVLLSCARMNRILDIDPLARVARVEPGVANLRISDAAAAHGLVLRPRSLLPGRLLDRRQCRGKLRRRALPQVRAHRAQRAGGARLHHRRRTPRTGQPRRRCPRARPAGPHDRLRGPPDDRHGSDGEADSAAAVRTSRHGLVRRRARCRGCRGGRDRRRHHSRGPGDDGPQGHRGRGAVRAGRLRPERGRDPAGRVGRHARGGCRAGGRNRARAARAAAPRRCACRAPRPSGCASGRAARTPFRPPGASRPTTTAWTAPCRAGTWGGYWRRSARWRRATAWDA